MQNIMAFELTHLNRTLALLMFLITPVPFLQWYVKMSKKVYLYVSTFENHTILVIQHS